MFIIIGLGNPGEQYKATRHNVGFMVLDKFAEKNNFPQFKLQKKYNAEISEKPFDSAQGDENMILVKPQTFMNESGKTARALTNPYTLTPKPLLVVIHDDVDLPVGKIKIVQERGSAGHKGVESIIKAIGNNGLIRIRVGIVPKILRQAQDKTKAKKIVLKKFSSEEKELINKAVNDACQAIIVIIEKGVEQAMNEYNK